MLFRLPFRKLTVNFVIYFYCLQQYNNLKTLSQERRKEAERMAREREELRRQQEQLRYEQEKRNHLKRGREVEHGYIRWFSFVSQQFVVPFTYWDILKMC